MQEPALVFVATDVSLYREFLITRLQTGVPAFEAEALPRGAEGIQRLAGCHSAAVVLVDLRSRDAHTVLKAACALSSPAHLIAFAVDDDSDLLACAQTGVRGYVPSDASFEELAAVIATVLSGEQHLPPRVAAAIFRRLAIPDGATSQPGVHAELTARERQILSLILLGLTNKEIAIRLQIELATVKNHVHNVLLKLHVRSRAEAVARVADGSRSIGAGLRPAS